MLAALLTGIRVAILVMSGFEQTELEEPKIALEAQGACVSIVSPEIDTVQGWDCYNLKKRDPFHVDVLLKDAQAADFDALIIPGALFTDDLRCAENAVDFVKGFSEKVIGTICHGPQILISADLVRGKTLTSYPSIAIDIINAGGNWVDQEVVRDGNLISSRMPKDLPAFNDVMIKVLEEQIVTPNF